VIVLRPAYDRDAARVGAILSEFIDTTPWMPRIYSRAEDIAHAANMIARGWVQVAEKDGRVAGFAACDGADLNALYIGRDFRGQGIGAQIVQQLQREQPELNLWTFQANTGAQRFYRSHGFTELARTQGESNDEGLPDVQFQWQREAA